MNKIVNINISGIIFSVDEGAYDRLKNYLDSLKRKFSREEGGEEILADIESRIAEMLMERNKGRKEVVLERDIDEVINAMGMPEEMAGEESDQTGSERTYPHDTYYRSTYRRLYRDEDNKVLGGVCAGLGAYFGIDYVWIRVIFVAAVFFGFGSGILIYILMWIIVPPARTAAEKLEMRGEPVNIDNIERTIRDNLGGFKKKINDWSSEVSDMAGRGHYRATAGQYARRTGDVAYGIGRALLQAFAAVLAFIGIMLLVSLVLMLLSFAGVIDTGIPRFFMDIFGTVQESYLVIGAIALVAGMPLLAIILGLSSVLFRSRLRLRWANLTMATLWITGIVGLTVLAYRINQRFYYSRSVTETTTLATEKRDTFYLDARNNSPGDLDMSSKIIIFRHPFVHYERYEDEDEEVSLSNVKLDIIKSDNQQMSLVEKRWSRGQTEEEARALARNVEYGFSQKDSLLEFDRYFQKRPEDKWRAQTMKMVLKVPVGKTIVMNPGMERIIYDIDNTTNTYDDDMIGHKWLMTEQGLHCLDCEKPTARLHSDY